MSAELVQAVRALDGAGAITPVSLDLSADMPFAQYEALGRMLGVLKRATSWWVGDYLIFGEATFGERYAQAAEATGLSQGTLLNYAWVCRSVPRSRRRVGVPFSVHECVAALKPNEQRHWLARAEREELTQRELRELLREAELVAARTVNGRETPSPGPDVVPAAPAAAAGAETLDASTNGAGGSHAMPLAYSVPGPLCRRLVQDARSSRNGWVQVPRELIEQLASVLGEED